MFAIIFRKLLPFSSLLLLVAGFGSPVFALNLSANWDYRQSGGEGMETQDQFQQSYRLGAGSTLSARPTHALTVFGALSYTRSQGGDERRTSGTDRLTPSGGLSLLNDIFMAQLSGNTDINSPDNGSDSSNTSWDASLASTWDIPLWPRLRFNYSEQSQAQSASFFSDADQKMEYASMAVDWDLLLGELAYRYSTSESEDTSSGSVVETDAHFVRFETRGNALNNRLGFNLAQQFQASTTEIKAGSFEDGGFPEPLPGEARVKVELGPDPTDPFYSDPEGLLPQSVDINERVHIRFDKSLPERIAILRFTLDDFLDVPQALGLQWSLYSRSGFEDWQPVSAPVSFEQSDFEDNAIDVRIGTPLDAEEVLLVATNSSGVPLTFTGLEAFFLITEETDTSRDSTSYLTNLSLRYRISRSLSASGNLILDQFHGEGDADDIKRTLSGNLRWAPIPTVTPSLGFSEQRREQNGEPDLVNRTYSLTVATLPLPALNVVFGATLGERYIDEEKIDTSRRYSLVFRAPIYPDLTANWTLSYVEREGMEAGSVGDATSYSSRLDLVARLRRSLVADLITNYYDSESSTATGTQSTQGGDAKVGLRYRPSQYLSLRTSFTKYFGDTDRTDTFDAGVSLMLVSTQKTRLTLNATHIQADESSQNLSLFGNWNISRHLSLWARANYDIAERNAYRFQVNLAMNL